MMATAQNGQDAVTACMKNSFDIILMDLIMPTMDGFATVESIRTLERQKMLNPAYIIALTAFTHSDYREKCAKTEIDDFFPKPYKPEELIRKIQSVCCV